MAWSYEFEVRDGRGKVHHPKGVVPFDTDTAPLSDIFNYAVNTMMQTLMAEGPRCPGPFRVLDIHMERV